jgi:hypothetical protein
MMFPGVSDWGHGGVDSCHIFVPISYVSHKLHSGLEKSHNLHSGMTFGGQHRSSASVTGGKNEY